MNERRTSRVGLKVIHRHRIGDRVVRRVSELAMIDGRPKALLGWISLGDVRTPLFLCDLEPSKLRRSPKSHRTYYYDEITVDPRYE